MSARRDSKKGGRLHRKADEVPASPVEVVRPERPVPAALRRCPCLFLSPRSQKWRQRRLKRQMGKEGDL